MVVGGLIFAFIISIFAQYMIAQKKLELQSKDIVRKKARRMRGKLNQENASALVIKNILETFDFEECFAYEPINSEIDLTALTNNKQVYYPQWTIDNPIMNFSITPKADSIILIPGLTFDQDGYRVGYGKGYYDRYLKDKIGIKVGVTYDELLVNELPQEDYDIKMDYIITPSKIIKIK